MIAAQACQQPKTSSERGASMTTCQYHFECFSVNTALWEISFTSTALHAKKRQWTFDEGRGKKSERLIFESEGRQFKKNARQDFFVDHCQCVYWTRRCCLTFSNLHRLSEILTFRREEAVRLEFSPQFGCLLNLSLTGLSEADRMIEYTPIFTVTTSTAVKQTWAKTELW